MKVKVVSTTAFDDQKPGTSGLRKKTRKFQEANYVENFVQATLDAVGAAELEGKTLVVGGDGRFYNDVMIQTILRLCAGNGVAKVVVGQHGLLSTPAVSHLIRHLDAAGGFILTASHNPGGPENDCGIKYNVGNGGPAPEGVTSKIFEISQSIAQYKTVEGLADVDLGALGATTTGDFCVEVVSSTDAWATLMDVVFDLGKIKALLDREDFSFTFDGMAGVAGPYAKRMFHEELGVPLAQLRNCDPSPTFDGHHPDPNLTYAEQLVDQMGLLRDGSVNAAKDPAAVPDFGAAADGDADRNMVLGKQFFVTPSDSLAVLAANASDIPFFRDAGGLKTVARSMPTSGAVDLVAKEAGLKMFEVPTGWKFFGNLMDSKVAFDKEDYNPLMCGEESFGTGSNHVREKDGLWAVLAWLQVIAARNPDAAKPLVSAQDIVEQHWAQFGKNNYQRYDYEEVDAGKARQVMARLDGFIECFNMIPGGQLEVAKGFTLANCDSFTYHDPVDATVSPNQGWRFLFADGSRFVFRLSGTGSVGATVRLYLEKYDKEPKSGVPASKTLGPLVDLALGISDLAAITGRKEPTVIT